MRLAWTIQKERGKTYLTFDPDAGAFVWTEDIEEALQLSRRADAELIAKECEQAFYLVEEHFEE